MRIRGSSKELDEDAKAKGMVKFTKASALNLPFESETFDRASMIHVGMNIADKAGVFRKFAAP